MNYPVWEVPMVGGGWVIGTIAIIHVLISHFAVGGGLFLPMLERKARRDGDTALLGYVQKHAKFFMVATGVFGASTGVGIWWAIGLVHAQATSSLIHGFGLMWLLEWVVFLIEMTLATFYYYAWDRVTPERHLKIGYLYAAFSWITLIVISGILSVMLSPGRWAETHSLLDAYSNPTYLPMIVVRTLITWSLAGVYCFWTATGLADESLKERVLHWGSRWILPSYVLLPLAGLWYFSGVPADSKAVLAGGMAGMASGNLSVLTRVAMVTVMASTTIGLIVYFGPYKNPHSFSRGLAGCCFLLAAVNTASTEWVREVLRKPFVIRDVMYTSGVRVAELPSADPGGPYKDGYLAGAVWASEFADAHGGDTLARGEAIYRGQCMSCHTRDGYRGIARLVGERDRRSLRGFLVMLRSTRREDNPYAKFMPPLVASDAEMDDLAGFLVGLRAGHAAH